ncbi:polyketide cyclase, partial [Cupriavidus sp. 2MCAB6]
MTNPGARTRTDSASRIVQASPQAIYRAFVDPKSLASWLPPRGMTGEILAFEPRVSGRYRMVLTL